MEEKQVKSNQYKCPSCAGNLTYCPSSQDLICAKCGLHHPIENGVEVESHVLVGAQSSKSKEYNEFANNNKVFKCETCGANIVLGKYEISKDCPYCGSVLIIDKDNIPGLKPDAVIPFAFDENVASEKYSQDIKKRFFAPSKFKKNLPTRAIKGIYIPSFVFNGNSSSHYNGELYLEHTVTDREGRTKTVRNYFPIFGDIDVELHNITVESSSKMTQAQITGVLPYEYNGSKPYKESYLLGYNVEHYSESLEQSKDEYRAIAKDIIERQILSKYSYDGVSYLKVSPVFKGETYRYVLLPVYRFEYEYKNKKYVSYMNGQTGHVDKNVPKSALKISILVILGILLLLTPILLAILLK